MLTECYDISAKRELLTAAGLEDCPKCTSKVPVESSAFSEIWKRKLKENCYLGRKTLMAGAIWPPFTIQSRIFNRRLNLLDYMNISEHS